MNIYFEGICEKRHYAGPKMDQKAVTWDDGHIATFMCVCSGVKFNVWVACFFFMCVKLILNLKVVDCVYEIFQSVSLAETSGADFLWCKR